MRKYNARTKRTLKLRVISNTQVNSNTTSVVSLSFHIFLVLIVFLLGVYMTKSIKSTNMCWVEFYIFRKKCILIFINSSYIFQINRSWTADSVKSMLLESSITSQCEVDDFVFVLSCNIAWLFRTFITGIVSLWFCLLKNMHIIGHSIMYKVI